MRFLAAPCIAVAWMATVAVADPSDPLAQAKRRNDELVSQGFNFTQGVTFSASPVTRELLVPGADGESVIALWFESTQGELAVQLTGPRGEVIASWRGRAGEQRITRVLAPGKYVVAVSGASGRGVIGVKGPVIGTCALDPKRVTEHAAEPERGFAWPYLLALPKQVTAHALLVLPNSTGFVTEDLALLRASAACQLAGELALADRLGTPVLMPLFPRPPASAPDDNLYLHALTRASLAAKARPVARVDLQLIAMIDRARAVLAKQGRALGPRVLISGFSAAGSFANRFAVLHADRTLAAAIGSPGGWPLAPVAAEGRDPLPYPVGIADVASLAGAPVDLAALQKVRFFFFLGAADGNDAVVFRDSFSATDEALVMRAFGKTPVARWPAAQRLYQRAKLDAKFQLYPGVAHEVTPEMRRDLEAAFAAALARTPGR